MKRHWNILLTLLWCNGSKHYNAKIILPCSLIKCFISSLWILKHEKRHTRHLYYLFSLQKLSLGTIWTWKLLYVSNISTSIFEYSWRASQIIAWYKSQVKFAHAKLDFLAKWLFLIINKKYNYCFKLQEKYQLYG